MGPEWVAIIGLVVLFIVGTALPINMGALGFVAAWLVGVYSLGLVEDDIILGMDAGLVLTIIGVTRSEGDASSDSPLAGRLRDNE